MRKGRTLGALVAAAAAVLVIGGLMQRASGGQARRAVTNPLTPMPLDGVAVQLTLGLKDAQPTDWDGDLTLSEGKVVRLDARLVQQDRLEGSAWKMRSRRQGAAQNAPMRPVQLFATFDAPLTAKVEVTTRQGNFSFALSDLKFGSRTTFLDGAAAVERVPLWAQITRSPDEEDFPACAVAPDGTIWCAYVAYKHGNPINTDEVFKGEFDSLVTKGNGDQIKLMKFDGKAWSAPLDVTEAGLDVWRPTVAVDGQGRVWVVWSQNLDGNWDLLARGYSPRADKWTHVKRLTRDGGADINPVANTVRGRVLVAWQAWRRDNFDIWRMALPAEDKEPRGGFFVANASNQWYPSIAVDSKGRVYVACDTYEAGNYDVGLFVERSGFSFGPLTARPIATSPRYEARPSIVVDKQDRLWIAYEDADPNWGKDYGSRWEGKSGVPFYLRRNIIVRCYDKGKLMQAAEVRATPVATDLLVGQPAGTPHQRLSFPRLSVDDQGRVWLLFRRHALATGAGERWQSFAMYYDGDKWSPEIPLPNSDNLMDNRPALVPLKGKGLLAIYSSDGRTGGTNTASENNLYAALLQADGAPKEPMLVAATPSQPLLDVEPVHPNEAEDIKRIRAYRATVGGRTYQLLRGEFHRHTEISSHRDQDGPFEDMWRYGLDVAKMDWIGPGDHDNGVGPGGISLEYTWWLSQKQIDMYHHPPTFLPMFTYERSVNYPSGHRNVMFAKRGIRPLPRFGNPQQAPERLFGTPEQGAPDTKNLFAYLKFFGGICSMHTSATNMGTDWRDNDPQVEPVVEIYQGHRQNYEEPKAPKAAKDAQDSIGGYQPAGFVWRAFEKGYRLGFQVSSDHISTHISYGVVFAEKPTREAILDAFKKRHSYGANDNIILDVRCGNYMMGDEFTSKSLPKLDILIQGTAPVARVDIVRQIDQATPEYVYAVEPRRRDVKLSWTDNAAQAGAVNMYYVRLMQEDGKMAWASPLWIRYEP
ncbi:MAG: hypothetical protein NZT92_03520 [Abditibacteriales bacterium]|nr:hypothetical protein [Abditibacteriales bacterium]MDW8364677.1 hypothetical protein [Abditibacteriales bacterium]